AASRARIRSWGGGETEGIALVSSGGPGKRTDPPLDSRPPMAATSIRFDDETARKRGSRISRMFDRIAPTYDVLNHVLSANVDKAWRKTTVEALHLSGVERCLDACTGTGDLAVALLEGGAKEVVGTDFAPQMVDLAKKKAGDRI